MGIKGLSIWWRRVAVAVCLSASGVMIAFASNGLQDVLQRFPTKGELEGRVDKARSGNGALFEKARRDFGDAIRVCHNPPKGPPRPGAKQVAPIPIVIEREPRLFDLMTAEQRQKRLDDVARAYPNSEWVKFYRNQLDAMTMDSSSPVMKDVLIDVVLNGWTDWSKWNSEKLIKVREKYPELHRVYAMRELGRLKANETTGILLEVLADPKAPVYVWYAASRALRELDTSMDQLEFVLDAAFASEDLPIRERMQNRLLEFSQRVRDDRKLNEKAKAFWQPYLDSSIPMLRYEARLAFGLPMPSDPLQRVREQQAWVAMNALDPARREKAAKAIQLHEQAKKRRGH